MIPLHIITVTTSGIITMGSTKVIERRLQTAHHVIEFHETQNLSITPAEISQL